MGSCNSVICSASRVEKIGQCDQVERKYESGESKGAPEVEIHINCPSNAGPWESELVDQRENTGGASVVSSSAEVLGFEADDELSSDTTSFQSVEESDHGKGEARNCAEREPGPSGLQNTPKLSQPPPHTSESKKDFQKASTAGPCNGANLTSESAKNGRKGANTTGASANSWDSSTTSDEAFENSSTSLEEEYEKPNVERREIKPTLQSGQTGATKASSWNSWDSSTTSDSTTSDEASESSSTSLEEEYEKPKVERTYRQIKSTLQSGQTGATKASSRNSWDSSTTSDEAFENSPTNVKEEYEKQKHKECIGLSWPFRVFKSTPDMVKKRAASAPVGVCSKSSNSWHSSTALDEDFQKPSTPGTETNVQFGARAKSCSGSSRKSSTNSHEGIDQLTLQSEDNKQKRARKARKWFRFKTNKVAPLRGEEHRHYTP